ncbi:hypothetical protein AB8O64_35750 (plasmid) [Streptomyces sp. QH1-20]|uniref:hypothetical protein n=1 Tax=Streptomyces sp. QH1-20 TaxID=3240934 RepID=UPI00351812F3
MHVPRRPCHIRRTLATAAALGLTALGLTALSAAPAAALPLQCTGTETPGNDTVTCPFLLAGQSINTGAGDDTVTVSGRAGGTINTGTGSDIVQNPEGGLYGRINTGDGDDRVVTSQIFGRLDLGSGNDQAELGTLSGAIVLVPAVVTGGPGNDQIRISSEVGLAPFCHGARVQGDDGADTITVTGDLSSIYCTYLGGAGNDTITVTPQNVSESNTLDGGGGTDTCTVTPLVGNTRINCEN